MTKVIEIGNRGSIVVYIEDNEIKVNNNTTCSFVVDGKLLHPGETRG